MVASLFDFPGGSLWQQTTATLFYYLSESLVVWIFPYACWFQTFPFILFFCIWAVITTFLHITDQGKLYPGVKAALPPLFKSSLEPWPYLTVNSKGDTVSWFTLFKITSIHDINIIRIILMHCQVGLRGQASKILKTAWFVTREDNYVIRSRKLCFVCKP